jgi:hypothetical protein
MTTNTPDDSATSELEPAPDPARVLESLMYELDYLREDAKPGSVSDLIHLHGALLVYNLAGRADLIPQPSLGLSVRSWRQYRVARAARRIVDLGAGQPIATMAIAADVITDRLHLIDPDLRDLAA